MAALSSSYVIGVVLRRVHDHDYSGLFVLQCIYAKIFGCGFGVGVLKGSFLQSK